MKKIAQLLSVIFGYNFFQKLGAFIDVLVSSSIQRKLKNCGPSFKVRYPTTINGARSISIGKNFTASKRLRLEALESVNGKQFSPQLIIGDNVKINPDCHIGCANKIIIGNNVLMASKIFISDHNHGNTDLPSLLIPPDLREIVWKGEIVIEDNVWIGQNVCILSNVKIGRNSVIGANSVVTSDIPPFSIAVGSPAKVVRQYQPSETQKDEMNNK